MSAQPGKHRRSFSSGKAGYGGDMAAAAVRAVQSVESGSTTPQVATTASPSGLTMKLLQTVNLRMAHCLNCSLFHGTILFGQPQ